MTITQTAPQIVPPDEHRAEPWHWIKVYNGETWAFRWDNKTGHWIIGNQAISPTRAVELNWVYIRPTETPPSAEPA